MQVEISGFSETEDSIVFWIYENKIFIFFLPAYEVHLKSLLQRVWELCWSIQYKLNCNVETLLQF